MRVLKKLPLRVRLGLLYAVLLIISVGLVGCYSYWNIWQLFISNKSSHLRARAKPIIEHWLVDNNLDNEVFPQLKLNPQNALVLARDLTSHNTVAVVLNRTGDIIANGKQLPEEPEAPVPDKRYFRRAISGENEVTYRSQVKGKPVLVLLIPLRPQPTSSQIFGVVQMSTLLTDIKEILFRHGAMLVSLVAVILFMGIGIGFWLIGVSLKDLKGLLISCDRISKGNFSQWVPIKNPCDEIGQLAVSFNQMVEKLEAAFSSQKRFVINAAHELMTPLTGLRGSLEVLLRGAQDDPSARARLLKGMYKEVNRLIRLCEQLLGLSRLENMTNVRKQSIVLSEFFNEFEYQAQVLACEHSVVIRQGPYVRVLADPDLLKQILLDLLSNALRYSPTEAPVVIGWKLLPEEVEIWVSDKGQGMDPETLSHIFEPFYQGKLRVVSDNKGIGLGLSLAKSMIEAHGGAIRIDSSPGEGTTVSFTIPLE